MTCDRLVCANCAGPVAEGRCSLCRAHRARMHQENPLAALSPAALLTLVAALIAVLVVVHHATA